MFDYLYIYLYVCVCECVNIYVYRATRVNPNHFKTHFSLESSFK